MINYFNVLSSIDCSKYLQKRNGLDYLPWAVAWKLLMSNYPESKYTVIHDEHGLNYRSDGRSAWVEVKVTLVCRDDYGTAHSYENTEMLAVMDYGKHSIPVDKIRSTDVINTIQRCLVKCIARFGLGINVYGALDFDDLPEENETEQKARNSPVPLKKETDLTEIRKKLEAAIKEKTAGMERDDKIQFVETVVSPALDGERNWKVVSNPDKLENLLQTISAYRVKKAS